MGLEGFVPKFKWVNTISLEWSILLKSWILTVISEEGLQATLSKRCQGVIFLDLKLYRKFLWLQRLWWFVPGQFFVFPRSR